MSQRHALPPIPHDREGKSTLLHRVLVFTGTLGRVHPLWLAPLWLGLSSAAGLLWGQQRALATGALLAFILLDGLLLALLPRQARSWGPVTPPWLGLGSVHLLLAAGLGWLSGGAPAAFALQVGLHIALSGAAAYATWIEPFRLQITAQTLALPEWHTGAPLRLLHISDLHFEGASPREAALLAAVEHLRPDLIVITGDYLSLSSVYDPAAQAGARAILSRLHAPLGVYAITGSPPVDVPGIVPDIFAGLPIHWLENVHTSITWGPNTLYILGVRCTTNEAVDAEALRQVRQAVPSGAPTLLLHHPPDLMPQATGLGITLYLAGHTHGGQLCLPGYGALTTSSKWGKRYEAGRYQENGTTLYVSRGLGLEGLGAPRARFCAPPEIVLWELRGTGRGIDVPTECGIPGDETEPTG